MTDATPADTTPAAPETRIRVLLFERDHGAREVPADELGRHACPSDEHLLWVDAIAADGPPAALAVLGVDLHALEPNSGGDVGLLMPGTWRHLFVRALNWQSTKKPDRNWEKPRSSISSTHSSDRGALTAIAASRYEIASA